MEIDLPMARVQRLAPLAESTCPRWPFDRKPEFVPGSCVHFLFQNRPIATATADALQIPYGARDPWYVWLQDFRLVEPSTS